MRHLYYKDAWGYALAISAIAGYPTLEGAKGFMADRGYEVSIRALETVQRNKGPEIEEARQKMARDNEESVLAEIRERVQRLEELMAHPSPQTG